MAFLLQKKHYLCCCSVPSYPPECRLGPALVDSSCTNTLQFLLSTDSNLPKRERKPFLLRESNNLEVKWDGQ